MVKTLFLLILLTTSNQGEFWGVNYWQNAPRYNPIASLDPPWPWRMLQNIPQRHLRTEVDILYLARVVAEAVPLVVEPEVVQRRYYYQRFMGKPAKFLA